MDNNDLQQLQAGSNYKFSATKIGVLAQGASEYTLATIVMDSSTSVTPFAAQLEQTIKTVFDSCEKSPRKANLLLRLTQFNTDLTETHGFKLLGSIKPVDYTGCINCGGMTALFDAVDESISATAAYGKQLDDQDFLANAIIVVVTDGENNRGQIRDASAIKQRILAARKAENLESITLILVGVTNDDNRLNTYLQSVKDDGGFDQYISIGTATPGKLAKLAKFVSQSISSTSAALGTGAPSQPINSNSFKF